MNFVFVCGGTAGHINPAIAIAEQMLATQPESKILFIGADRILEKRLVPAAGFDLVNIKMSGLRRGLKPKDLAYNIKTAMSLIAANSKSAKLLKTYKPDAVIGTGGYICYPVLKKAAKFKIPTLILEPNALPGLTVRMLSATVDKILVTFPGLEDRYKKPQNVIYTGTPLKKGFFEEDKGTDASGKSARVYEKPLVVSFWGSLGASKMNREIADFIRRNIEEKKFYHIHATGVAASAEEMRQELEKSACDKTLALVADIREYIDDMPSVMKAADIVISRAGASTIAELAAQGKPAILIPSPNVTENHQEVNAMQMQKAGGAIVIKESESSGDKLFDTVAALLDNKEKLEKMKTAQKTLSAPDASKKIVEIILDTCRS